MIFVTEAERYRILSGVHMWDLHNGGKKRDWEKIVELAEVTFSAVTTKRVWQKLSQQSDIWFPYPIIFDNYLSDAQKRFALFDIDWNIFAHSNHDTKTWDQIVQEISLAANEVEPWVMHTRQVKHFLGFYDDVLNSEMKFGRYKKGLEMAEKMLPPEKQGMYASYRKGEENTKDAYYVRKELNKIIQVFREEKEALTFPLRLDVGIQSLTDVSYYRRKLYEKNPDVPKRLVLSDYELMEVFKYVLQHGFDTSSMDNEYWEDMLSFLDIENFNGMDARADLFRIFLPRFELLKTHLEPNLDCRGFNFDNDIINVYRVIYHSCSEGTYLEVLRTVTLLVKNGWLNINLLGGVGHHYSSFKAIIKILKIGAHAFNTTQTHHICLREKFITDLCTNYRKFKHL